jgi:hypothetical protein
MPEDPERFGGAAPPPDYDDDGVLPARRSPPGEIARAFENLRAFPDLSAKERARCVHLDARGNRIASVPRGLLSSLASLERVTITGNALTAFPDDLAACARLTEMYAGANRVADVAIAFAVPNLAHLGVGETASHTTPFAWCTSFLKDFPRRHSSPALPFQRLTGETFD